MIVGIGVDVLEIARLERELARGDGGLVGSVFTTAEQAAGARRRRAAAFLAERFAAKEAFFKALGAPSTEGVAWREVEVQDAGPNGVRLALGAAAAARLRARGAERTWLALAHTDRLAAACVVLERI